MISFDQRFPTRNTNLAACLGALRIPIKSPDPCWVVEEAESPGKGRVVTYFFEMAGKSEEGPDAKEPEQSLKVDWAWRNREKFESESPTHPLVGMRRALEKLEWLTKVYYCNITPAPRPGKSTFQTSDIILAACLMASGHTLHSFAKPFFHFVIPAAALREIQEQFDNFRVGTDPVAFMRRALEVRKELIDLVKRAPLIDHYTNGDPMEGGKEGFIARGVPEQKLKRFLELLYE